MGSPVAKASTPTSATGTLIADRQDQRGFTLVEILVVMLIIGIVAAGALLSLGVLGQDRQVETERQRLETLLQLVRDRAGIHSEQYGLRVFAGGYEFMRYDSRAAQWQNIPEDDRVLRRRTLPAGLQASLLIDGRPVVLPKPDAKAVAPQVLLYSSGELNAFELTVLREGSAEGFRAAPAAQDDSIVFTPLPAAAR